MRGAIAVVVIESDTRVLRSAQRKQGETADLDGRTRPLDTH